MTQEVIMETLKVNNRIIEVGTEVSIKGESGRFIFRYQHRNGDITVWGGRTGHESMRSFRLNRVARVHYKSKTRTNKEG
jgi:hypothetical protein